MTMHRRPSPHARARKALQGFTLIELLISMTIGLILMTALGVMMNMFEKSKRQNSTTSDLAQSSGYLAYELDRQFRSIGSGLFQNAGLTFGCQLNAIRNGAQILPRLTPFPAPFQAVPGTVNVSPVVVYSGVGVDAGFGNGPSDIVQFMTTSAGLSETPQEVIAGSVQVNTFKMNNTLGIRSGDLLMLTETSRPCLITQVGPNFVGSTGTDVPLDGAFYAQGVNGNSLVAYGVNAPLSVSNLGNVAGNQPRFQLLGVSANSGVLYPLQSLRRESKPYPEIPLLTDANQETDRQRITDLARSISRQVSAADNSMRLKLHLAAVLVNNFTNHLYVLADQYCRKEGADFSLLLPLIRETAGRLSRVAPEDAQTGPAVRGDEATIAGHLELIDNYKDIKEVYTLMTRQIREGGQQ